MPKPETRWFVVTDTGYIMFEAHGSTAEAAIAMFDKRWGQAGMFEQLKPYMHHDVQEFTVTPKRKVKK